MANIERLESVYKHLAEMPKADQLKIKHIWCYSNIVMHLTKWWLHLNTQQAVIFFRPGMTLKDLRLLIDEIALKESRLT